MSAERTGATPPAEAVEERRDPLDALIDGLPPPTRAPEVKQTYGTVELVNGDLVVVRVAGRAVTARRAVGCLVDPGVGDTVLVALAELGEPAFVLSVLTRGEQAGGTTLSVQGDVTLRSRSGSVSLLADDGVSLVGGKKVEVTAPELEVEAMETSFVSASLSYVGHAFEGQVDRMKLVARTVDRVISRLSERLKTSFRTVEELEKVRAKELQVDVEGNVSLHSDNTILSSEQLVKVDGEQIHLG